VHGEADLLARCYRSCFALAAARGVASLAFPGISTGAYGFPHDRAAGIAVAEMMAGLSAHPGILRVVACCFDDATVAVYRGLVHQAGIAAHQLATVTKPR
jgi:O-acetyl-ADP-ribose deacetylase (regulator of RNase III)